MTDVESNVCCGTHVSNLSQLQVKKSNDLLNGIISFNFKMYTSWDFICLKVIKLLHVIKKKGKCLLHFLSGNRVLDRFAQQFQREQQLMGILK